jgi:hypothetical protein
LRAIFHYIVKIIRCKILFGAAKQLTPAQPVGYVKLISKNDDIKSLQENNLSGGFFA